MKQIPELPKKITQKNMWVCVCPSKKYGGYADYSSISHTRSLSIKKFIGDGKWNWSWWKRRGWHCKKVNITYEIQKKS